MLEILSRLPDGGFYIITKSPAKKSSNSEIKIKEIGAEMKPLNEYENSIIIFSAEQIPDINRLVFHRR